jgi:hypothetical protein
MENKIWGSRCMKIKGILFKTWLLENNIVDKNIDNTGDAILFLHYQGIRAKNL